MLCRLCLKDAQSFLKIFDADMQLGIADIVERYFWFKPHPDDGTSTAICTVCWTKVYDFHQFYVTIEQAHSALRATDVKDEFVTEFVDSEFFTENVVSEFLNSDTDANIKEDFSEMPCIVPENHIEIDPIPEVGSKNKISNGIYVECKKFDYEDAENLTSCEDPSLTISASALEKSTEIRKNSRKKRVTTVDRPTRSTKKSIVKDTLLDAEIVKKYVNMGCELCIFVGEDFAAIRKHFGLKHPKIKPFVRCCNRKLFDKIEVIQHAYKHEDPEFFKCQECLKLFSKQGSLSRHLVSAHASEEQRIYHCDQCPKRFAKKKQWEYHRNSHVPMNERTFTCDQCPSRFACNELLKMHICMYHSRAPNVCHVCAKEIRNKKVFEKHVRLHFEDSGPKVKCTMEGCNHWAKDNDNLREHIGIYHSKEKKIHSCDKCGKEFKNRKILASHKRNVHSGKPFTCEVCKKTFRQARYLREHITRHTGEILYECKYCTHACNSNSNMYKHIKKMHPIEWDKKTHGGSSK